MSTVGLNYWRCLVVIPYMVAVAAALGIAGTPMTSDDGVFIRLAIAPPFI